MATLTTEAREKLSDSDFALPGRRYPIHDPAHARDALARVSANGNPDEQSKVRSAVARRYPNMSKAEITVEIWKNEAQQIVYGVVLAPDLVDSQGDIVDAVEIEKAAHNYLTDSRRSDVQHSEIQAGAIPIESYIAPHDMLLHGQIVKKGSWVMAHKIVDDAVWEQIVKGELTGLSIGGSAMRLPD